MKNTLFSRRARASRLRALWTGAAALGFGLITAGCGGGGSGPKGPDSATITANRTPLPSQGTSCSNSYSPNYASSVRLLHWTQFPLRVYFIQDANLTPQRQALAIQGFNRWVQETNAVANNNGVSYNVVSSQSAANVTVKFYQFTGGPGDTLGITNVKYYDSSSTIDSADINLGVTGDTRNDLITNSHEFGHALGILGHSPVDRDLMYFEGNDAYTGDITPSDLNTLLTAYCGNFNRSSAARTAHSGELKTMTIR